MAANLRGIVKDKGGDVLQSRRTQGKETLFYAQLKHKYLARDGARTWPGVEAALGEFMARTVKYIRGNKPRMTEIHKFTERELDRGEGEKWEGKRERGESEGRAGHLLGWLILSSLGQIQFQINQKSEKAKKEKSKNNSKCVYKIKLENRK